MRNLNVMKKALAMLLAAVCLLAFCACKEKKGEGADPLPYSFVTDGVTVTPGVKAADTLAALSSRNPAVSFKSSCLGGVGGEDVNYVYDGFYIQTFRLSEGHPDEEIRWIVFSDDSVTTQKGIKIGSTLQEVKDAYGAGTETEALISYVSSGVSLRFTLRDGAVIGIAYTVAE